MAWTSWFCVWIFARLSAKITAWHRYYLVLVCIRFFGSRFDLILVLRSQFFDFLRESFTSMPWNLEAAGLEKNGPFFSLLQQWMPINIWLIWTSVIGRYTFSVLASVLGPSQKNGYVILFHCSWQSAWYQICDIRVANACGIRAWRNLGYAWTSS